MLFCYPVHRRYYLLLYVLLPRSVLKGLSSQRDIFGSESDFSEMGLNGKYICQDVDSTGSYFILSI